MNFKVIFAIKKYNQDLSAVVATRQLGKSNKLMDRYREDISGTQDLTVTRPIADQQQNEAQEICYLPQLGAPLK